MPLEQKILPILFMSFSPFSLKKPVKNSNFRGWFYENLNVVKFKKKKKLDCRILQFSHMLYLPLYQYSTHEIGMVYQSSINSQAR